MKTTKKRVAKGKILLRVQEALLSETLEQFLVFGVFGLAVLYSIWLTFVGWDVGIFGEHSFRQTQTALTSLFMARGGPFWAYETPVLGPPWSIPMEFPIYQWLAAKLSVWGHMPLEPAGRLVGRFFFYLTLWPFYEALAYFRILPWRRFLFLSLYLLSPLYLFWSRTFMMESTALFFCVAYLACALLALLEPKNNFRLLALGAFCGALGAACKVTTFAPFGLLTGLFLLWHWRKMKLDLILFQGLFLAALPLAAGIAWTKYSDHVKALNPLADFLTAKGLEKWNFGTLAQRMAPSTWYMFFRKTIHDSIGHRTTWILANVAFFSLPLVRKKWPIFVGGQLMFLVAPMMFTNLHIAHNYYAYANGIFLVFALGYGLYAIGEWGKKWRKIWIALYLCAVVLSVRQFQSQNYYLQLTDNIGPKRFGEMMQKLTGPEDVLFIYGWDYHPAVPYYANRRAIMDRDYLSVRSDRIQASFRRLAEDKKSVGALLDCFSLLQTKSLRELHEAIDYFHFARKPVLRDLCDVYMPQR